MYHTSLIRPAILAWLPVILFATACTKEKDTPSTMPYTYRVQCDSCNVSFLNPLSIAQREKAVGTWQHSVFMKKGQPLSITAISITDSLTVQASIQLENNYLGSNAAPDSVTISAVAQ